MACDNAAPVPPVVFYDANVLYPFHLRNLLVQLGVHRIVAPRWTDAIHDEWIGSLAASGAATRERLLRTRDIMKRVLPDADIRGYEHRIAGLTLPDPDDRHVLAAAIHAHAEAILTFNLKDFPTASIASLGVIARDPDAFLCDLHAADPEAVLAAVDAARMNLTRTAPSSGAFIDALERQRLVGFAACLRSG